MEPPRTTPPNARTMRVIHFALTLGLTLCGVMLFIMHRVQLALVQGSAASTALTAAAIAGIILAVAVLRPRVPTQTPDQTSEMYWGDATVRTTALILWAVVDGAGLLAAVGYLLTGATAPAITLVIGILTLAILGPRRFEQGDG